ncbi:small secreted hydrophilic protein [Streptomyces sp. NPDC002787]
MVFSRRIAALAAVVAIPLGIAATSFALTDSPQTPKVPPKVELESGSPGPTPSRPTVESDGGSPTPTPSRPKATPSDEVVSRPPVTDSPASDDDDDRPGQDGQETDDDGPGDDG